MATVEEVIIRFTGQDGGLSNQIRGYNQELNNMNKGAANAGNSYSNMGMNVMRSTQGMTSALTEFLNVNSMVAGVVGMYGVQSLYEWTIGAAEFKESTQIMFQLIPRLKGQTKEFVEYIKEYAQGTPVMFRYAAEGMRLIASSTQLNIDQLKKLTPAAMDMASAYELMGKRGGAMAAFRDLQMFMASGSTRMLIDSGIPMSILSKYGKQMKDAATKGDGEKQIKIVNDMLTQANMKGIGTAETFTLKMAKLKGVIRAAGSSIGEALLPPLTKAVVALTNFLQYIGKGGIVLIAFALSIGIFVMAISPFLVAMMDLKAAFLTVTVCGNAATATSLANAFAIRIMGVNARIAAASQWLNAAATNGSTLATIRQGIANVWQTITQHGLTQAIWGTVTATFALMRAMVMFLLTNPVGWAILLVVAIIGLITYFKQWGNIINWLKGAWGNFIKWLQPAIDAIKALGNAIKNGLIAAWQSLISFLQPAISAIQAFAGALGSGFLWVINNIGPGLIMAYGALKSFIGEVWNAIKASFGFKVVAGFIGWIYEKIVYVLSAIYGFITSLNIMGNAGKNAGGIFKSIMGVFQEVYSFLARGTKALLSFTDGILKAIVNSWQFKSAMGLLSWVLTTIWNNLTLVWKAISTFVAWLTTGGGAAKGADSAWKSLGDTVKGISDAAHGAYSWLQWLIKTINSSITGTQQFKDLMWILTYITSAADNFIQLMVTGKGQTNDWGKNIVGALFAPIMFLANGFKYLTLVYNTFKTEWDKFVKSKEGKQTFKDLSVAIGEIKAAFGESGAALGEAWGSILPTLQELWTVLLSLKEPAMEMINALSPIFNELKTAIFGVAPPAKEAATAVKTVTKAAGSKGSPKQNPIVQIFSIIPVIIRAAIPVIYFVISVIKALVFVFKLLLPVFKFLIWVVTVAIQIFTWFIRILRLIFMVAAPIIAIFAQMVAMIIRFVLTILKGMTSVSMTVIGIIGGVVSFLFSVPQRFYDAGRNLVKSLTDGIVSLATAPVDAFWNIVNNLRNLLPFSPAKVGPLKTLRKAGIGFWKEFNKGFVQGYSTIFNPSQLGKLVNVAPILTMSGISNLSKNYKAPSSQVVVRSQLNANVDARYLSVDDLKGVFAQMLMEVQGQDSTVTTNKKEAK